MNSMIKSKVLHIKFIKYFQIYPTALNLNTKKLMSKLKKARKRRNLKGKIENILYQFFHQIAILMLIRL